MLNKLKVKFISKILYEKICYLVINKMISIFNGICFMYIEFLFVGESFLKFNICVGFCCKILYFG